MSKQIYNGFKLIAACLFSILIIGNLSAQDSSDEYFTLARAEGTKGNFAKAASYCEKGLKKSPLDMDIKEYLGKCYMELGQLEKARMTLLDVLKHSPRRVDARHYLINIETQEKRYYSAVCYANELLEITPYAKELWLKKVQLYNLMDNRVEANRTAKRLYQIFPEDNEIKSLYNNILKDDASRLSKGKDYDSAIEQYEKILDVSSTDPDTYLSLINAYIKKGNYAAALSVSDRGLQAIPFHQGILDKKIALLDETLEYQKAITVTEERLRKSESPHYRNLLNYLTEKAARFYKNSDPYVLYGKIYERNPKDKEAFDYLLNTSIARGYYPQAEELLKKALKSSPNAKDLLAKQLYIYEAQKNWEKIGSAVENLYALYPSDADVKEKYETWTFEKAKLDYNAQNYKEALWGFLKVSSSPIYAKYASQYIFAIHTHQKSYDEASKTIDNLIKTYPQESQYALNKIDLLLEMQEVEAAYQLATAYAQKNPNKPEYIHMANETALAYVRYLNKNEDYQKVKQITDALLQINPQQTDVFNYGLGARVAMKQYDEAIAYIQANSPNIRQTKNLQLKLAGVYSEAGKHQESISVLKALRTSYPYNDSLKTNLVEEMLAYAKALDDSSKFDQSKLVYEEARLTDPKNTTAAIKLTNILIEEKEYNRSMQIIDSCLLYNKDYPDLLYQKGLVYEKIGDFTQARQYQAQFMGSIDKTQQHKERLDYLESKELKNQVNISYLNVTSDSTLINTSVATLEYLRQVNKNNTLIARVNYAARKSGVGVQGELDWYHTFKNKSSFIANAGIASQYFPKYKAALSFFQPFAKKWQVEIGGRYTSTNDNERDGFITGIIGLERNFDKVWLNVKGLVITDRENLYHSILAQSRFYMKNERNYIVAMAGAGTAPEDQRLDFQVNTFTSFVNTMVGAGYFHHLNARTAIGIHGNWYNFKMSPSSYINQYNLFFTVRTRF